MKYGNDVLIGSTYQSVVDRLQILIETTLHRGREVVSTSISVDDHRFYACVIWREIV